MMLGKITIKTNRIGTVVEFEAAVVHISNFLPTLRSTREISSVETELEVKIKNQERKIASLRQNDSIAVVEHPIEQ